MIRHKRSNFCATARRGVGWTAVGFWGTRMGVSPKMLSGIREDLHMGCFHCFLQWHFLTHHGESSPFLKVTQAVHMEMGSPSSSWGFHKPVIHDDWMTGIPYDFGNLHCIYHYQPLLTTLNHRISSISPSYHISIYVVSRSTHPGRDHRVAGDVGMLGSCLGWLRFSP